MPESRVVVPLLLFAAMGAVTLWLVWRVVVSGGRARRENAAGGSAIEIARRCEQLLEEVQSLVDEIRRRKLAPALAADRLAGAREALMRHSRDAQALTRSPRWAALSGSLCQDIERGVRAVELVVHGSELMAGEIGGVGEGEAEVKRGYLNLVHARGAIQERREQIATFARGR